MTRWVTSVLLFRYDASTQGAQWSSLRKVARDGSPCYCSTLMEQIIFFTPIHVFHILGVTRLDYMVSHNTLLSSNLPLSTTTLSSRFGIDASMNYNHIARLRSIYNFVIFNEWVWIVSWRHTVWMLVVSGLHSTSALIFGLNLLLRLYILSEIYMLIPLKKTIFEIGLCLYSSYSDHYSFRRECWEAFQSSIK